MKLLFTFLTSLILLAGLDFVFLGYLMKDYYQKLMSPAVTIEFNLLFAFLFYFLYMVGIFIFVLYPHLGNYNPTKVFLYGAMFGFFCYMTYDLTNIATIKNWPLKLIFIDIAWGAFVTSVVASIAYQIFHYFN